jgi:hypothetical protein
MSTRKCKKIVGNQNHNSRNKWFRPMSWLRRGDWNVNFSRTQILIAPGCPCMEHAYIVSWFRCCTGCIMKIYSRSKMHAWLSISYLQEPPLHQTRNIWIHLYLVSNQLVSCGPLFNFVRLNLLSSTSRAFHSHFESVASQNTCYSACFKNSYDIKFFFHSRIITSARCQHLLVNFWYVCA